MITTRLTNLSPEDLHAMCCELEGCTVASVEDSALCDCECSVGCTFNIPVFAKVGGTSKETDQTSFLFRVLALTDVGTMELFKLVSGAWVKQDDLNTATYGTFYDFGDFTNLAEQELYTGYVLDWESVLTNFGTGQYYVNANLTVLGQNVNERTDIFNLEIYSASAADNTVSIKTIQNGNIRKSPFDFTGMNWVQWVRLYGHFGFRTPTIEKDIYLDSNYTRKQVQDQIRDEYTLEINTLITGKLSEDFIYSRMLANEIFITDYNLCNTDVYCEFPVDIDSFSETYEFRYVSGRAYLIKFVERTQDRFKRNFK